MRKDNVLNVMEQTERKSANFLDAWKRGVAYLGPELFGPGTLATAKGSSSPEPSAAISSISVDGLQSGTTYYWKLIAEDDRGATTQSETRSFSIE